MRAVLHDQYNHEIGVTCRDTQRDHNINCKYYDAEKKANV